MILCLKKNYRVRVDFWQGFWCSLTQHSCVKVFEAWVVVWWTTMWFGSLGPERDFNGSYFAWRLVAREVLQGSVLVMFDILIYVLEEGTKCCFWESCSWERTIPHKVTGWGLPVCGAAPWKNAGAGRKASTGQQHLPDCKGSNSFLTVQTREIKWSDDPLYTAFLLTHLNYSL